MGNKKFENKVLHLSYEAIDEKWLDKDTYVLVFQDMIDNKGDVFHLEVEYHKDEDKITWSRVYEHETMDEPILQIGCQKEIERYILQRAGVLREGSFLHAQEITLSLKIDLPKDMTVGELHEWLNSLKFEIVHTMTPKDERARIIEVTRK